MFDKTYKKLLRIKIKNKISKSAYLILIPRGDYFKSDPVYNLHITYLWSNLTC